jgi:hypothetical protein
MTERPNAILRGGPFDGKQVHTFTWVDIAEYGEDGTVSIYRPTAELDEEYTALVRYEHESTQPTASASA